MSVVSPGSSMRRTPRWSVAGAWELSAALRARLPASRAIVWVGPPLFCSGPRSGLIGPAVVPTRLPCPLDIPLLVPSPIRSWSPTVTKPSLLICSAIPPRLKTSPPVLPATIVLVRIRLAPLKLLIPPPESSWEMLRLIVQLSTVAVWSLKKRRPRRRRSCWRACSWSARPC